MLAKRGWIVTGRGMSIAEVIKLGKEYIAVDAIPQNLAYSHDSGNVYLPSYPSNSKFFHMKSDAIECALEMLVTRYPRITAWAIATNEFGNSSTESERWLTLRDAIENCIRVKRERMCQRQMRVYQDTPTEVAQNMYGEKTLARIAKASF
jgi:hypothetical protein